jgi:hypothetical protein
MNEGRVLLHIWEVQTSEEPAALRRLEEMFGEIAEDDPFMSARVLDVFDTYGHLGSPDTVTHGFGPAL